MKLFNKHLILIGNKFPYFQDRLTLISKIWGRKRKKGMIMYYTIPVPKRFNCVKWLFNAPKKVGW